MKFKLNIKPGILISIIGIICLTASLAIKAFTVLERAIIMIISFIVIIGGTLSETPLFERFKNKQTENWN